MSLFNRKIIETALAAEGRAPTDRERAAALDWAARARGDFAGQTESQLEQEFNRLIVRDALGYEALTPDNPGTMKVKQQIGAGVVDVALGRFTALETTVLAPLELKGPRTGLDSIMPGRAKTPVQQAWEYANDAVGAKWVLVSNMKELRLYAIGHGRADYEIFDLRRLDDPGELKRLQLLLHADRLLSAATAELLQRSAKANRDITDELYRDYKRLRDDLIQFVRDQRSHIAAEARIALVQKLLDRLIFIAFAEDTVLIPDDSIKKAVDFENPYDPKPKWEQIRRLFDAVDRGATRLDIAPYNGGLFAPDTEMDALDLPDHLVARFADISAYDFRSEVSVTILGHIFEQSISDIEALQAEARGEAPPKTGARKRFGVVYTPEFVTRFIVEKTIGAHLAEIRNGLLAAHAERLDPDGAVTWRKKNAERDYWQAYLDRMAGLRIVDPACGSGAFLIAAFDYLYAEQRVVRERLAELDPGLLVHARVNADVEIITRNLYGVDVNAESVEITKLALWLKTAKRGRRLESLDHSVRCGNSLIESADVHSRAFVWRDAFPEVFQQGGFDIALGNPPYVRMELLTPIKPYLEKRYEVVSDRADLYAYFFELGVRLLRPGGRLGYISSSTFFRTGSGEALRRYLVQATDIETVVDFGELQIFAGVTTYPAILTLRRRNGAAPDDSVRFLNVKPPPDDLSKRFEKDAAAMPRARLTARSWRFEADRLEAIRARMAAGRPTLAEIHGAPLRGIVTGLNEAFVVSREVRDALVARDARSAEILKPFLIGENLKRWHVESDDLWLIYTPKCRVAIDDYPAIRDHLAPYRAQLEARATRQNWWELQQAQAAYEPGFKAAKLIWPHFQDHATFCIDDHPYYLNNKCFFWTGDATALAALLNAKAMWFLLSATARTKRGGYIEAEAQYVGALPSLDLDGEAGAIGDRGDHAARLSKEHATLLDRVCRRFGDISTKVNGIAAFREWPLLDFAGFRAMLVRRCRTDIAVAERDQWESWFNARKAEALDLERRIADIEAEINDRVYRLFDLDADAIAAIEEALAGAG
jgi:hypothetical protein